MRLSLPEEIGHAGTKGMQTAARSYGKRCVTRKNWIGYIATARDLIPQCVYTVWRAERSHKPPAARTWMNAGRGLKL